MMSILGKLNGVLHAITPHLHESTQGILSKIGLTATGTGIVITTTTKAAEQPDTYWLTMGEALAIVTLISVVMYIFNLGVQIYTSIRKDMREKKAAQREEKASNQSATKRPAKEVSEPRKPSAK